MTERVAFIGAAVLLVALCLMVMGGMHEAHYKRRELQLLRSRIDGLESIILGNHD